jgi:hypothetical protein
LKELYDDNTEQLDLSQLEESNLNIKDLDYAFTCKEVRDSIKRLVWFFVSFRIVFSDNTTVRILIFFVAKSVNFFFQNLTLGYNNTEQLDLSQLEESNLNIKDLDYAFTCKEVRDSIKRLKKNKQPGIDLIHNELLIYGKNVLLLPIVNLFNRVLSSGVLPDTVIS